MTARWLGVGLLVAAACSGGGGVGDDVGDDVDGRSPDAPTADAGPDAMMPPDGGADADDAMTPVVPPEIDGRIVINEVMVNNALTLPTPGGGPGRDWIELYNPTDQAIPLAGYTLTDDLAVANKAAIGPNVTLPARGRLVLWADDDAEPGPTHLGFHLATEQGVLGLARPDGTWIDRIAYGQQETDFSAAREPDGSDRWVIEWLASPGAPNPPGSGQPVGPEVASAPPESVPAAGDLSERLLGYDAVPELALTISPAGMAALEAHPADDVEAQITFAGRTIGPVAVHLKGHNSFQPITGKPSLRVKIDAYVDDARLFGLKDLTLNNMDDDFSMMHERLAYLIARMAAVPASRATHARLTINGIFYGLYTNVETVKRKLIGRWFTDDSGPLFGVPDVDFAPNYVSGFELETGADDRHLLTGLANALTLPSADAAIAAARSYLDVDEFLRYWAMASIVGQFDALPYSVPGDDILLYADPTTDKLVVIPWGMDETFYSGQYHVASNTSSVLARRCKESPACWQAYVDQVWALQAMTETMDLAAERVRVMQQIAPWVTQDTRKLYTDEQVAQSQSALYWFIHDRRANLATMLPPPSPAMKQWLPVQAAVVSFLP